MLIKAKHLKLVVSWMCISIIALLYQNCGGGFELDESFKLESSLQLPSIPPVTLQLKPNAITQSADHDFRISLSKPYGQAYEFQCRIDTAPTFTKCENNFRLSNLSDGAHEIAIKAVSQTDPNIQSSVLQYAWVQDRTAPTLTINERPSAVIGMNSTQISFSATESLTGITKYECSVNASAFSSCQSPYVLSSLQNGNYTFKVKAYDGAGNVSTEDVAEWTVSLGVPTVKIDSKPDPTSNAANVSLAFSGVDSQGQALASYQCDINGSGYQACSSPVTYSNLSDGNYTFKVKAKDSLGRESSAASYSWQTDRTAPTINITSGPAGTISEDSASFVFSVSDNQMIQSVYCQLDSESMQLCSNSKSYENLSMGAHTFTVRATDTAGNTTTVQRNFEYELVLDGATLYANNCAACHSPLESSKKLGRTASQISAAISSVTQMNHLNFLKAEQIEAIAVALNQVPVPTTKFKCVSPTLAGTTNPGVRRLKKEEFKNTVRTLIGNTLFNDSEVQAAINSLPDDEIKKYVTEFSPDAPIEYLLALTRISEKVVSSSMADANLRNAIFGSCSSSPDINCAKSFISNFGKKVFRRPLTSTEFTDFENAFKTYSGTKGMYNVFYQMMQAPPMVFHLEMGNNDNAVGRMRLTDYEVASRISYLTTASPPDSQLMQAAGRLNELQDLTIVKQHVERLMSSSSANAKNHIEKMLSYYAQLYYTADPFQETGNLHQIVTSGLSAEYKQEAKDFLNYNYWTNNSDFQTLMTTRASFPRSETLRYVLGANSTVDSTNQPVLASEKHLGLLHRPALLSAVQPRTSPILRGAHIRINWLCDDIPDPPASALEFVTNLGDIEDMSNRHKTDLMTSDDSCMGCHSQINPLGYTFENFDQLGVWRTEETAFKTDGSLVGMYAIDTAVNTPSIDSGSDAPVADSAELVHRIAQSPKARACFVQKVFEYSRYRELQPADYCSVEQAEKVTATGSLRDVVINAIANEGIFWRKHD